MGRVIFGFHVLGKPWIDEIVPIANWVAVTLTIISGGLYLWRNRQLYLHDA